MAFIHKLAIVVDVFIFLAISMDTRFMLIKTKETDENFGAFTGNNSRFIAGNKNCTIGELYKASTLYFNLNNSFQVKNTNITF